jgi:hypothetical protein
MSLLSRLGLRRAMLATCAFAAVSLAFATPALADRGHGRGNRHWRPPMPRVIVGLPLPPLVIVAGPRGPRDYDYDYDRGYGRRGSYDRGYEDGYDDGYDDRGREERRRRHRHRDCDHDYYY